MARIQAVIFDWAGTTVDFGCMAPVKAFMEAFKAWNLDVTLEEIREPMGMAKRDHIETMLNMPRIRELFLAHYQRDFTQSDIDDIYILFEKQLLSSLSQHATPKPYVLEAIQAIRDMGMKIGSTTGYNHKMMEIVTVGAKAYGYEPDVWYCADHVDGFGRPYPYMVFKNMQTLGIASVDAVVKVGDTQSDIAEGLAAGVRTIGVVEGSSEMGLSEEEWAVLDENEKDKYRIQTREHFLSYGANFVIDNFYELPKLLSNLPV